MRFLREGAAGASVVLIVLAAMAPAAAQIVPDPCAPPVHPCIGPIGPAIGGLISFGAPGSPLLALQYERLNERERDRQREAAGTSARAYAAPSTTARTAGQAFGADEQDVFKAPPVSAEAPLGPGLAWLRVVGRVGSSDATKDDPATDMHGGGAFIGVDLPYDAASRFGFAAGYSRSFVESDGEEGNLDADGYHVSAYATHTNGPWRMRAIASYAYYQLDSERDIVIGRGVDVAVADYAANNVEALAEISYVTAYGPVGIEPYAAVGLSWLDTDAFSETGVPRDYAVSGPAFDETWPYTVLGTRFSTSFAAGTTLLYPTLDLGWRHVFGDVDPQLIYTVSNINFAVSGVPIAEDTLMLGLGLDSSFANGWRGTVKYLGELASDAQVHTFSAGFAIPF